MTRSRATLAEEMANADGSKAGNDRMSEGVGVGEGVGVLGAHADLSLGGCDWPGGQGTGGGSFMQTHGGSEGVFPGQRGLGVVVGDARGTVGDGNTAGERGGGVASGAQAASMETIAASTEWVDFRTVTLGRKESCLTASR